MARDGDWLPMALVFAQPLALTTEPQPGRCQDCSSQTTEQSFLLRTGKNAGSAGPGQALPIRALASWAPGTGGEAGPLDNGPRGRGWRGESWVIAAWAAWEDEAVCAREACGEGGAWPLMRTLQRPQFPELCSPHVMNPRAGKPWETSSHCWVCRGKPGPGRGGEGRRVGALSWQPVVGGGG